MENEIDVSAKTDRELLIMVVDKLNSVCSKVNKVDKAVHGNGVIGLKTQVLILWCALFALMLGGKDAIAMLSRVVIR